MLGAVLVALSACSPQCGPKTSANPSPVPSNVAATTPSSTPAPTDPLQTSSATFHGGEVGVAYAGAALTASGGRAPYKWTIFSGALPAGLTLGDDGSITGTPTTAGNFSFTLQVADSANSTASIPAAVSIIPALTVGLIGSCVQYCNVELGCDSTCGAFGQQNGGAGPFTYSLAGGQLPAGTSLNGLSLKGSFKGSSGWLQFTVKVTDSLGATASVSPKFWMYDHISLASGGCMVFSGQTCSAKLHISGGVPGDQFSVKLIANNPPGPQQGCGSYGPPPAGSYGVSGSDVVIAIPGTWPNSSGYGAIWILQVSDTALCAASTPCSSNQGTAVVEVQCG